jgi:sugar phosphate permease
MCRAGLGGLAQGRDDNVAPQRCFPFSVKKQRRARRCQYTADIMEAAPTLRQEMALICVLLATYVAREFVVVHFYNLYSLWTSDVGANTGDLSLILSLGTLTGIVFKLVFGALADSPYVGGKSVYCASLFGTTIFSVLFTMGHGVLWFLVCWVGLQLFVPGTWIGLVCIIQDCIPRVRQGRALAIVSLAYTAGEMLVRGFVAALVGSGHGWRLVVLECSMVGAAGAIAAFFALYGNFEAFFAFKAKAIPEMRPNSEPDQQTWKFLIHRKWSQLQEVVTLPFFTICMIAFFLRAIRAFFLLFAVGFALEVVCVNFSQQLDSHSTMKDSCHLSPVSNADAAWVSAFFPGAGALSILVCGYLKDRIPNRFRSLIFICFLTATVIPFSSLARNGPNVHRSVLGFAYFVGGIGVLGPYSLLGGAFACDVGGQRGAGTASAIVELFGSSGALMITIMQGSLGADWALMWSVIVFLLLAAWLASLALLWNDIRDHRLKNSGAQ